MQQNSKNQHFYKACLTLAEQIAHKQDALLELLSVYETHETVHDEIQRSVETLHGVEKEMESLTHPLNGLTIATFFPLNLPLYSLVLFGIVPSLFASHVYIRPPEVMHDILTKLWDLLDINSLFPTLSLKPTPRHIFMDLYVAESDVIIFTGKYENALDIHNKCPHALLVYNGSGVNPFLLFGNADVNLAVKKAVEMRCFNSGQDCAGPDAFIVPSSLADTFIDKLKARLDTIKVGDTIDPHTDVGRTMKESYILELQKWIKKEEDNLVYGGDIDEQNRFVYPSIVHKNVNDHTGEEFHEFFAPYFYVLEYENNDDLEKIIHKRGFRERAMYVSVFGSNPKIEHQLGFVKLLRNVIVNDVEIGNSEYGGYGTRANFLLYDNKKLVQPILISRDIHAMLGSE